MSPAVHSGLFFALAGLAFTLLGALGAAVLVRLVGARLARWEPRARHRALLLLAALPAVTGLGLLFAVSLPSLLGLVVPSLDHCLAHAGGHSHLCFVHLPEAGIHPALVLSLGFVASYVALRAALALASLWRSSRVAAALANTGELHAELGITVIEAAHPVCLTVGLLRPRVLLSRGLFETLDAEARTVVVAHERAHLHRRDALASSLARALAVLHLPGVGRYLVRELSIAAEQTCDEEAARLVDRVAVAETILTVERAVLHAPALGAVAVAFGACAIERRIEALLEEPAPRRPLRRLALTCAAAVACVLVLAGELHHLAESALSVIAH